ncbi:23S rRNA pseudouridine2605 synthase [Dyella jiangningensis]|uniref:pseudouridine synthase n=1 Tax=Dyella sp. AtDHG13 TaxID=1938897 RepID=UPI000884BF0A|nr:pseudouridine synthase [Dyella sp. AtDHG13]PXV61707.1 pseudouridine synthase [Dyella sp. AtDHG13]SDJ66556.1 23S rRNA pseudouridine2605 synthase [Dyella jiangningensis]
MRSSRPSSRASTSSAPRHGLARVLSKMGVCSRSQAEKAIREGRVRVDGKVVLDPERPADPERQRILLDDAPVAASTRVYIALNKPRGIVVSAADERGRDTVYDLLKDAGLPWLGPVGRLDKASEGLLLLSNDSVWAARLTEPRHHVDKTYHVQVNDIPDQVLLDRLVEGIVEEGERLAARRATLLRHGEKNAWLEIVLDEGRNRHIRRLLGAHGIDVLRLIRVAIGPLALGELPKGQWRHLSPEEARRLGGEAGA